MRNWKLITITQIIVTLLSVNSLAAVNGTKAEFDEKLRSVYKKITSKSALTEKIEFIQSVDKEWVGFIDDVKEQAQTNPTILLDPVYIYSWDLYYQMIPLVSLKMNAQGTGLNQKGCAESESLVKNSNLPGPEEEEVEDKDVKTKIDRTVRMIRILCGQKN